MDDLFTFELNIGADESCMTEERLEDTVYNCLDFCLLYRRWVLPPSRRPSTRAASAASSLTVCGP